jgi:hypothetical protein
MESKELQEALRVRSLLVKAIEEKGEDYVYPKNPLLRAGVGGPQCTYANYKPPMTETEAQHLRYLTPIAPSCLVGHAAYYAGVDLETLKEGDTEGGTESGADRIFHAAGATTRKVFTALRNAQTVQDRGQPWRLALAAYDRRCSAIEGYEEAVK